MFTGLVEAVGTVVDFRRTGDVFRLSMDCPQFASELFSGQSVAVSGACLSVVALRGSVFDVEMMPETVTKTRFSSISKGDRVNLERAMKLDSRLEGHLVLGHVDGTAVLETLSGSTQTRKAWFHTSNDVARLIVAKGSVAIDGVSLTVIDVEASRFSIGLIPTTLENCTLGELKSGESVNVETDIVGKYVERLLGSKKPGGLTFEELYDLGYR